MSEAIVYHRGEYAAPERATVPLLDRGFLFGDGVFETLRTYGKRPHGTAAHLARLRRSAAAMEIPVPWSDDELTRVLEGGIARVAAPEVGVRFWVTRGQGGTGYELPARALDPALYMLFQPLKPLPATLREHGAAVVTVKDELPPSPVKVKTIGNPAAIQAQLEARRRGADEVLRIGNGERLLEGSRSNVFVARGGDIVTPPLSDGVLDGITRQTVIDTLRARGRRVDETSVTLSEALAADEIFLTRTTVGAVPVVRIDDRTIGDGAPGPIARELMDWFAALDASHPKELP